MTFVVSINTDSKKQEFVSVSTFVYRENVLNQWPQVFVIVEINALVFPSG